MADKSKIERKGLRSWRARNIDDVFRLSQYAQETS